MANLVVQDALLQTIEEDLLGDDACLVFVHPTLDSEGGRSPPFTSHLGECCLSVRVGTRTSAHEFLGEYERRIRGINCLDVAPVVLDERREERRRTMTIGDHRNDRATGEELFQALLDGESLSAGERQECDLFSATQAFLDVGFDVLREKHR